MLRETMIDHKNICKGLRFRYNRQQYFIKNKLVLKDEYSLLKRMSCKGCPECSWILEELKEGEVEIKQQNKPLKNYSIVMMRASYISQDSYCFVVADTNWG